MRMKCLQAVSYTHLTDALPLLKADEYPGGLWYYEPHTYQPYRYVLGRVGRHPLVLSLIHISCGDLPKKYLEYLTNFTAVPGSSPR